MSQFVELEKYTKALTQLGECVRVLELMVNAAQHSVRTGAAFDRPNLIKVEIGRAHV